LERKYLNVINPSTALDEYIRPKTIAACIGYSASYSRNFENHQQSRFKFKIDAGEKPSI